jgi:hypothetical protein
MGNFVPHFLHFVLNIIDWNWHCTLVTTAASVEICYARCLRWCHVFIPDPKKLQSGVGLTCNGIMSIPNFIKVCHVVQWLKWGDTHRHHCDLLSMYKRSVHSYGTTWELLNGYSWNLIFENFTNSYCAT